MKRRPYIIGILGVGLAFTAAVGTPGLSRIALSAQNFRHCFRTMKSNVRSIGPVELFAYSVVLANSQPPAKHQK